MKSCVGKGSCDSQAVKEGRKCALLLATVHVMFITQNGHLSNIEANWTLDMTSQIYTHFI